MGIRMLFVPKAAGVLVAVAWLIETFASTTRRGRKASAWVSWHYVWELSVCVWTGATWHMLAKNSIPCRGLEPLLTLLPTFSGRTRPHGTTKRYFSRRKGDRNLQLVENKRTNERKDRVRPIRLFQLQIGVGRLQRTSVRVKMQGRKRKEEEEEEEEEVVMDADGRIAFDGSMDFGFRAWPRALPLRSRYIAHYPHVKKDECLSSSETGRTDAVDKKRLCAVDALIADCKAAFVDGGVSFWVNAGQSSRCGLEELALAIFKHHTSSAGFDPSKSGVEWWVQMRQGKLSDFDKGRMSQPCPAPSW